jgi:hypothetical protein
MVLSAETADDEILYREGLAKCTAERVILSYNKTEHDKKGSDKVINIYSRRKKK